MTTIIEKIKADIVPGLISSGLAIAGYSYLIGESPTDTIVFFGSALPAYAVIGGTQLASTILGDVLQNQVLSYIPNNSYAGYEGAIAKPVISGLSSYGMFRFGISPQTSFVTTFALGALSTAGADYAYENLFQKK